MKKKVFLVIVLVIIFLIFLFHYKMPKHGVYQLWRLTDKGNSSFAMIELKESNQYFFSDDGYNSYLHSGTYRKEDGKLFLEGTQGTSVFELQYKKLVFQEEDSSFQSNIKNGDIFIYNDNED